MKAQQLGYLSWELAIAIATLMIGMTVLTGIIGRRVKSEPGQDLADWLGARVKGWWLIVAFVLVAKYGGSGMTLVLLFFVSFYALREFYSLTPTSRSDHYTVAIAFYVVLPLQYVWIGIGWYAMFVIFIPMYAYLFLPLLSLIRQDTTNFLARVSTVQWGLMASVFCISHLGALMGLELPTFGRGGHYLVIYLLLIVQLGEAAQEFVDRTVGRWKLSEQIDPARTVEGLVAGVLTGVFLGVLLSRYTPYSAGGAFVIALATMLAASLGSLTMAAIKRDRGVKDFGGVMDRLQSVCFAAPVYFHLVRYFYAD
jgi:phosphatidate cytidylyltransferase